MTDKLKIAKEALEKILKLAKSFPDNDPFVAKCYEISSEAHTLLAIKGEDEFKIEFIDCWEQNKDIPESDRWLASNDKFKIVVTAPTKEKAFDEVIISMKVLFMYHNQIQPASKGNDLEQTAVKLDLSEMSPTVIKESTEEENKLYWWKRMMEGNDLEPEVQDNDEPINFAGDYDFKEFYKFIMDGRHIFFIDDVRQWVHLYNTEQISFSKFVELFNIKFFQWVTAQPSVYDNKGQLPEEILQELGEKEVMIGAFAKIRKMFENREWIMEGRGSYRYDDDRYKEEVRYLFDECDQIAKDTWANIKTKTFEYREKIIADYLATQPTRPPFPDKMKQATEGMSDAVEEREWPCENCETGEMKQDGGTSPNGTTRYKCTDCGHTESYP